MSCFGWCDKSTVEEPEFSAARSYPQPVQPKFPQPQTSMKILQ